MISCLKECFVGQGTDSFVLTYIAGGQERFRGGFKDMFGKNYLIIQTFQLWIGLSSEVMGWK